MTTEEVIKKLEKRIKELEKSNKEDEANEFVSLSTSDGDLTLGSKTESIVNLLNYAKWSKKHLLNFRKSRRSYI